MIAMMIFDVTLMIGARSTNPMQKTFYFETTAERQKFISYASQRRNDGLDVDIGDMNMVMPEDYRTATKILDTILLNL